MDALKILLPGMEHKAGTNGGELAASCSGLYDADGLRSGQPAALVDGEMDALRRGAGSWRPSDSPANGQHWRARHPHWQAQLRRCSVVLVAFDADEGERVALNPDQVIDLDLPRSPDALKEGDRNTKRYREWLAASGHPTDLAVELDALPPATLQELASDALRRNADMSAFVAERQQQAEEQEGLADLRQQVQELCNG